MLHAYNKARLTRDRGIVDVALWLLQSDHLHLIQWFGRQGAEAEVSAYFTPEEWWRLGGDGIVRELVRVYLNFVSAIGVAHGPRGAKRQARYRSWIRRSRTRSAQPAAGNVRRRHEPVHGRIDLWVTAGLGFAGGKGETWTPHGETYPINGEGLSVGELAGARGSPP